MDRILEAATELFAEKGSAQVSVRDVAERAGVSHALVHRYFGNKEDLVQTAFERTWREIQETMAPAKSAREMIESILDLLLDNPLMARMMLRNMLEDTEMTVATAHFPVLTRAMSLASEDMGLEDEPDGKPFDIRLIVGALAAMTLGWTAAETRPLGSTGLDKEDPQMLRTEMHRLIGRILAMAERPA
jgi:AcrR family transcriptional regulator